MDRRIFLAWLGLLLSGSLIKKDLITTLISSYDPTKAESIKIRTGSGDFKSVSEVDKKYAILLIGRGNNELEDEVNRFHCYNVYNYLLVCFGYNPGNMFVLYGGKTADFPGNAPHKLPSTKKAFEEVITELEKVISEKDMYLLYTLTHGFRTPLFAPIGNTHIILGDGSSLSESELEQQVNRLKPNYGVTIHDACYSGRIAERLGRGNRISIASTKGNKLTYGKNLFVSMLGRLEEEPSISLEDAFDYAAKNHEYPFRKENHYGFIPKNNTPLLVYDKIDPKTIRI